MAISNYEFPKGTQLDIAPGLPPINQNKIRMIFTLPDEHDAQKVYQELIKGLQSGTITMTYSVAKLIVAGVTENKQ